MALTEYGDLQFRYNSQEDVEIKDFLPIIGNEMPNKLIKNFDETTTVAFSSLIGGTDNGLDKIKAYKSTACRKCTLATTAGGYLEIIYTPAVAVDLTSLSETTNNFATVKSSGKYKTSGTSLRDTFHLVLNMGHYYAASATSLASIYAVSVYNGSKSASAYTTWDLGNTMAYKRNTYQILMDSATFTYAGGFTDSDWESITKIKYSISNGNQILYTYFHNVNIALPRYSAAVTDSYYPNANEANSIFVSYLFGNDANAGTNRSIPVKTLEKGISLVTATRLNVVILDSETYKPIAVDYTTVGIQQTLGRSFAIMADYLETPKISAEPGLLDADRVGAREDYRTEYYENQGGAGTKRTVGTGGTYATIAAAYAAASGGGDCIEILDDANYTEKITGGVSVTIQAAPGKKPTWTLTSNSALVINDQCAVTVNGIVFVGSGADTDVPVSITPGSSAGNMNITFNDCTFKGVGTSTNSAEVISLIANGAYSVTSLICRNCLFVDNGENVEYIKIASACRNELTKIVNCKAYIGTTAASKFMSCAKASNSAANNVVCVGSDIIAGSDTALSYAIYAADAAAATRESNFYFLLNECNCRIKINGATNTVLFSSSIKHNYFHTSTTTDSNYLIDVTRNSNAAGSRIDVVNNLFVDINNSQAVGGGVVHNGPLAEYTNITGNIFTDCAATCIYDGSNGGYTYSSGNVFINCSKAIITGAPPVSAQVDKSIFVDCTVSVDGSGSTVVTNCLYHNSPCVDASFDATCTNADAEFIDYANFNFGWYFDSPIESNSYFVTWLSKFFNPTGSYTLTMRFLNLEGFAGQSISTASSTLAPQYCHIHDWTVGIKAVSGFIDVDNCLFEDNGIACRVAYTAISTPALTSNSITTSVFDGNNTAILLRSGCTVSYITAINGDYGITAVFSGFYDLDISDYMMDYISITNSILFDNDVYDYYFNYPTDYCIIGKRYFDMLPPNNASHVDTIGTHDLTDNPALTAQYFPSLKILGYKADSPAYCAASTATQNIGARNINRIKAAPSYGSYTVSANPQEYEYRMLPVNLESSTDTSGNYEAETDTEIIQVAFNWTEPGRLSKIMATQKTIMGYVYQTYWIVGISTDDGSTWTYYKVNKEVNPATKQIGFYYSELPWGEWTLEFYKMPDSFLIADYTVNTMES